jgi:hypothetical protein
MKVTVAYEQSGERTRLACRLPAGEEIFLGTNKISQEWLFGEAPKSAREARALPR